MKVCIINIYIYTYIHVIMQVEWLHLRTCLVPSWCGASRTISDCCWSWGISRHLGLLRPSAEKKRAQKLMIFLQDTGFSNIFFYRSKET